jgi:maltose/moltooligosaccharide transporter
MHNREALGFQAPLIAAQVLAWGGMFALWVFGYLHIHHDLALDETETIRLMGLGMALYVMLAAAWNFALPAAHARLGMVGTHASALIVGGVGIVLIAQALTPPVLLVGYAITSVGWSSLSNTPYAMVTARVSDGRYARAMAWFNLSVVAPQIALALALGWLIAHVPPADAIRTGGVAMMLAGVVIFAVRRDGGSAGP